MFPKDESYHSKNPQPPFSYKNMDIEIDDQNPKNNSPKLVKIKSYLKAYTVNVEYEATSMGP